jgi:O-antigen ligase
MDVKNRMGQIVLWGTGSTTLLVTPFFSYDPINVPRFISVLVFGLVSFFLFLGVKKELLGVKYRKVLFPSIAFIGWSLVALFASKVNLTEGFFGVTGRQTGFLAYFALIVLMLLAVLSSSVIQQNKLVLLLVWVGLLSGLYGVLQALGHDPFDWINPYSPVFGFFGNPNFQASFMGMGAVAAVALSLKSSEKLIIRIGFLGFVLLALFNIYQSKSQQGYLVFLAGVVVVGYLYVRSNLKSKKFSLMYLVASVVGFVAVLLDILQKSPWNSILYKDSVAFRGDFWRAGWKMTSDNPVFGVGLDGYRDHYRASRDLVTVLRPGSDAMTDSAHNVFLDISSGGGFPLLIIYVFLIGLTIFSAIKVIRRSTGFDVGFAAVLGVWVAYLAQSLISINQLGLAVWGWVLMGTIIGYEINTREKIEIKSAKTVKSGYSMVAIGLGFIIGLGIGLPLMLADATFRSTVKSGDVLKIEASVRQWPQSVTRMTLAAQILREGDLPDRSIVIAREAVAFNPMNFEAWRELSLQPNATESERAQAQEMLKKLDPFNPNLN